MSLIFFFNDTATTEIYTLSLHDALPIFPHLGRRGDVRLRGGVASRLCPGDLRHQLRLQRVRHDGPDLQLHRSEEHTSELQSRQYLVCRLLLAKKTKNSTVLPCPLTTASL